MPPANDVDIAAPTKLDATPTAAPATTPPASDPSPPSDPSPIGRPIATPTGTSIQVDPDKPVALPPTEAEKKFLEMVPEEYRESDWVKSFAGHDNPLEALFKEHANQRSLIGRKAEGLRVPADDAPADEWKAFHQAIGVPEKPEDYSYTAPQVPEHLKEIAEVDDALLSAVRNAAIEGGLTKKGFQSVVDAFNTYYVDALNTADQEAKQTIAKLDTEFSQRYGARGPEVLSRWKQLSQMAPEWARPIFQNLAPPVQTALAAWADNVSTRYIKEDKLDLNLPTGAAGLTQTGYGDKFAELFAKQRQYKPGSAERAKVDAEITALRGRASEVFQK